MIRWVIFFILAGSFPVYATDEPYFPDLPLYEHIGPKERLRVIYPADARNKQISGSVRVAIAISSDGLITDKKVIFSEPPGVFDKTVLDALSKCQFYPHYLANGTPIAFQTILPFVFRLSPPIPPAPLKLVWRTENMKVSVIQGGQFNPGRKNQYLHLTQTLNEHEAGWKTLNIVLPDRWRINKLTIEKNYISLVNDDGTVYQLSENNVEEIQRLIKEYYPVSDEKLLEIWQKLALVREM